jgi:hypothetical protein
MPNQYPATKLSSLMLPVLSYPTRHQNSGTVISTEPARAFGEQRSGEIRFSTATLVPQAQRERTHPKQGELYHA